MTNLPPGWYPANDMVNTLRYWDGSEWTEHVQAASVGVGAIPSYQPTNGGLLVAGYLGAIVLPLVGFILGCVIVNRDSNNGAAMIVLSLVCGGFYYATFTGLV